jgi:hypothetical protein
MLPVVKWCKLIAGFSSAQREKFASTPLGCMLQIPNINVRSLLVKYMLGVYDPASNKFIIEERVGEISAKPVDVECLLGLGYVGLCATDILEEEEDDAKERIPPHFLSKRSGNLNIDDLIEKIIRFKAVDDDFLRMVVLVLLGTVLAPTSGLIISKGYYALVEDVNRMMKINWNEFTLGFLMRNIKCIRKGRLIREWPKGNLLLLQVIIMCFSLNNFRFVFCL